MEHKLIKQLIRKPSLQIIHTPPLLLPDGRERGFEFGDRVLVRRFAEVGPDRGVVGRDGQVVPVRIDWIRSREHGKKKI